MEAKGDDDDDEDDDDDGDDEDDEDDDDDDGDDGPVVASKRSARSVVLITSEICAELMLRLAS
jgi:hypothetical protein